MADNILGSFAVVVQADTAPVERAFEETEKKIRRASRTAREAAKEFRSLDQSLDGTSRAAQKFGNSILYVSQGIEDLQYGLRATLNNLPQIVMSFGGGAGLAGVISLVAVGANLLYEHWDDLTRAFTGQAAVLPSVTEGLGDVAEQIRQIDQALEDLGWKPGMNIWEMPTAAGEAKARFLLRQKAVGEDVLRDRKTIERFGPYQTEAAEKQARAFQEVVKKLPRGAQSLRDFLAQGGMGPHNADHLVAEALRGDAFSIRSLLRRTKDEPSLKALQGYDPDRKEHEKQKEKQKRLDDAEAKAWLADIERIEKETRRQKEREKTWALEDRMEAIQKERKEMQYRDQLKGLDKAQIFGSGLDYANAVQAGDGEVRRKQLETQKKMDDKLGQIRDELKKQQRARFQ